MIETAGNSKSSKPSSQSSLPRLAIDFAFFQSDAGDDSDECPDGLRAAALIGMHLGCLAVFYVGWSWVAIGVAVALYVARAFGLTAFYHRYFSHRAFKTTRWFQFVGAALGCLALQKGPLWWAAHHREHHRHSDREGDVHSPHVDSFWWAHFGWFLSRRNGALRTRLVRDWIRYPELVALDRLAPWMAAVLAATLFVGGETLRRLAPGLQASGLQLVVWGFFISTVLLYHATYSVNSIAHLIGSRRFSTNDDSRNNWLIAVLTLGEGWHNNHHFFPSSARQGFYWWEIDATYYALVALGKLRLVWDLNCVRESILRPDDRGSRLGPLQGRHSGSD